MHVRRLRQPRVASRSQWRSSASACSRAASASAHCPRARSRSTASRTATGRARPWPSWATSMATASATTRVGLPNANGGSGMVYVFLGHPGALSPAPTALDLAAASFTITGHGGEMLGFAIAGDDVNGDGSTTSRSARPRPARRARPTAAPCTCVRLAQPQSLASTQLFPQRLHQRRGRARDAVSTAAATTRSASVRTPACRWPRCPTSTATATGTSRWALPTRASTVRARATSRCSTASPAACTSTSATCGRTAIRTTSTSTSRRSTTSTSARASRASAT